MSGTIISQLIWKDLRLNRTSIIVPLVGGAFGLGLFMLRDGLIGVLGIISFFTAMIISASMLPSQCLISERSQQTLAFLMSLPLSSIQYTLAKMITILGIYLIPWLTLVIAGVSIIFGRADVPDGLLPLFLALCLLVLTGMCIITGVALVSESAGIHGITVVAVNVSYSFAWLFIAGNSNLREGVRSPVPVWNSEMLALLGSEVAAIALILGVTFFLQSRKRDFV